MMSKVEYRRYRKRGFTWARPYVTGEDLSGVSVSAEDTPGEGGLIAVNPENPQDKWYISAEYAKANYELAEDNCGAVVG